jgi:hypothetical protein
MILSLILALAACGNIDYHERTAAQIEAKAGYSVIGWTEWTLFTCDIYLMPADEYVTPSCYEAVIKHEERHCRDHHFHPDRLGGGTVAECPATETNQ